MLNLDSPKENLLTRSRRGRGSDQENAVKRNYLLLMLTLALLTSLNGTLMAASITAMGVFSDYIPTAGTGLGGVANCTSSGLNAISP